MPAFFKVIFILQVSKYLLSCVWTIACEMHSNYILQGPNVFFYTLTVHCVWEHDIRKKFHINNDQWKLAQHLQLTQTENIL